MLELHQKHQCLQRKIQSTVILIRHLPKIMKPILRNKIIITKSAPQREILDTQQKIFPLLSKCRKECNTLPFFIEEARTSCWTTICEAEFRELRGDVEVEEGGILGWFDGVEEVSVWGDWVEGGIIFCADNVCCF